MNSIGHIKYTPIVFTIVITLAYFYTNQLYSGPIKSSKQSTTAILYMAADNDLYPFSERNIMQIQSVLAQFDDAARHRLKIAIHIDMHRPGHPKISRRYLSYNNKLIQVEHTRPMDSGDPETLIDCCRWAIEKVPSENYILFLWNHGLGIIEPPIKHAINPYQLFKYNPKNRLIELNRTIGFLDFVTHDENQVINKRSICFDDTTGNFLTNEKLHYALATINKKFLKGKKITLCCDACLMAMIEVISPLKDYVDFFISSQEVELGTGYHYTYVFNPFITEYIEKRDFAVHTVNAYHKAYSKITQDFTQSAIDVSLIKNIDEKIDALSLLLIEGLEKQKNRSIKETIRASKHKNSCTHFDEPTYIDCGHFCMNLIANAEHCELRTTEDTLQFRTQLKLAAQHVITAINNAVIANVSGKNLSKAQGLSIYFPEYHIHSSYRQSIFATKQTHWYRFLAKYTQY